MTEPTKPHVLRYRPHRGHLEDSMQEAVEVDGYDGLIRHLGVSADRVSVTTYWGADDRIGWRNTYMVEVDGRPWGFAEVREP